jgi:hypothetical protein
MTTCNADERRCTAGEDGEPCAAADMRDAGRAHLLVEALCARLGRLANALRARP